ncbi:MAG: 4-hydroxythreonine-4-phosphate dehydrogenase PdxA [Cyanobacteria bacterium J06635_15]
MMPAPPRLAATRPRIAIPMGDPAGIGIEVVLKALALPQLYADAELTVVGTRSQLERHFQILKGQSLKGQILKGQGLQVPQSDLATPVIADPTSLSVLDLPLARSQVDDIQLGCGNAASGEASFAALKTAIDCTVAGKFDAIVTAPIAKAAWQAAGHDYPGQTELLADGAGVSRFGMLFVARSPHCDWILKTLLATTHIPLRAVPDALTPDLMSAKLSLLIQCLKTEFGLEKPRIAIAGLNPHSGEQGQLGHEEVDWLIPWLEAQRLYYPEATLNGPIPPDTLWVEPGQAWYGRGHHQAHDAYLALYHDQGLIPLKLLAFDRAVNTTIGLPFIRTSPDHGTAFDIAGRGIADPTSMIAAIELAVELVQKRLTE